jgi:hypothetical protein
VDSAFVVLGAGFFLLGWVADGDQVEGCYSPRDTEDLLHVFDPFLARVDPQPNGSEAQGGGGKQDVLGARDPGLDVQAMRFMRRTDRIVSVTGKENSGPT